MRNLLGLWPDPAALNQIMKTDAESASEAGMLAVHQPMRFRKRRVGDVSDEGFAVDEKELLQHFLADNADGRVIVPIVGTTGSGKSHVIRWLHVQLRNRSDAGKRKIIRVPKGRSLRGVLEDLLRDLEGPQYDVFRTALRKAQDRIEPERAAHQLCEGLAQEVEELARMAVAAQRSGQRTAETDAASGFGDRRMLPTLLRDQRLRDEHFITQDGKPGVVRRLVAHLYEERTGHSVDDRSHVFVPDDLLFSDSMQRELLGRDVQSAMEKVERDAYRSKAAAVLNEALDRAKQQLLGLSPTITDLFEKIRQQLLADGMELILLVEDFVVLSGLQGQLLQVMVQEAMRDGRQVRCTMRAAIAYTPGYLHTDTVLSRAAYEYGIEDRDADEAATKSRIRRLVAAYLNAARLGDSALTDALRTAGDRHDGSWIPRAQEPGDDATRVHVEAFGRENGIPLHPFSGAAILALAEEGCRKDQRLVYNPRSVINYVLLRVLQHRAIFAEGAFPDPAFRSASAPALAQSLAEWIQRVVPPPHRARYVAFLTYWGFSGADSGWSENLSAMAEAFSLPAAVESIPTADLPPRPEPRPGKDHPPPPRDVVKSPWTERIEAWRTGQALGERDSRTLRRDIIGPVLYQSINWDWFSCRRRDIDAQWWTQVWIEGTASQPANELEAAVVLVAELDRREPLRTADRARELTALADTYERNYLWNEFGEERDLAMYCAVVERHTPDVRRYLQERPFGPKWSPVSRVVQALAVGARVLQVIGGNAKRPVDVVGALFAVAASPPTVEQGNPWEQVRTALSAVRTGWPELPSWRAILLDEIGARQSGANLVHAIDAARLKPEVEDVLSRWEIDLRTPQFAPTQRQRSQLRALLEPGVEDALRRLPTALAQEVERIADWCGRIRGYVTDDVEPAETVQRLVKAIEPLQGQAAAGVTHADVRRIKTRAESTGAAAIRVALATDAYVSIDMPRAELLWRVGRIPQEARLPVLRFFEDVSGLLDRVEETLREKSAIGGDPLGAATQGLRSELDELMADLERAK